jgi:hypothetical protein
VAERRSIEILYSEAFDDDGGEAAEAAETCGLCAENPVVGIASFNASDPEDGYALPRSIVLCQACRELLEAQRYRALAQRINDHVSGFDTEPFIRRVKQDLRGISDRET